MYRIDPALPAGAYKTYGIDAPSDVSVKAACEQVGCAARLHGWETAIDEATDLGRRQAEYIRTRAGRTFRESRTGEGLTVFRFDAGQRCFAEHRTRPEVYTVRGGDWRVDFGPIRTHTRSTDWVEDFGDHQARLAEQIEKG